jgi:hypothetical protein
MELLTLVVVIYVIARYAQTLAPEATRVIATVALVLTVVVVALRGASIVVK